jgi:hypothetical protein
VQVGLGNPMPPGLPKQLRVGQRVLARHKDTQQMHDGTVLTIQVCMCNVYVGPCANVCVFVGVCVCVCMCMCIMCASFIYFIFLA